MTIFSKSKMSESLSEGKDVLSGFIELLDDDDSFLFSRFCFFRSSATSGMLSISIFLVFDKCGAAYHLIIGMIVEEFLRRETEKFVFFFIVDDVGLFLQAFLKKFETGRTKRDDVNTRTVNVSVNVDYWV